MATMTLMADHVMGYDMQRAREIREKLQDIFFWDCPMNDTMLLKRYTVDSDGDLVMIVR
jgi:hypothetical protein